MILKKVVPNNVFQNNVLRYSHQDAFFNIAVLRLWWKYLKNTCDGGRILVNLHVTLSNFEPLLWKFKYFIPALINAEQLLLYNTSVKLLPCTDNLGKILIRDN